MGTYILKDTKSGKKTLVYRDTKEVRIHSAYDPEKEASRSVENFQTGRSTMIMVSGIGLGFHIKELKNRFPDFPIIAVEHDREVIDTALKTYPEHFAGVPVICSAEDFASHMEELDISGFKGIAHYIHRPSYSLYNDYYDSIMKDINQFISSKISDLLTRFEFEERWTENILKNARHLFSSPGVEQLFGRFRGYPGIIVSAGPSLRNNIDILNKIRGRALIVCVDTALKVLLKKDIHPHIVITLDAQKHSLKHFLGSETDTSVLLADLVSYPAVLRTFNGRKIISTTSKFYTDSSGQLKRETTPFIDWLEQFVDPIGDIQSGGSVATSAFDLLLNLGCDPIILAGQDLAYTGREIHCSGTHHNDDWIVKLNRFVNLDTINQGVVRKRQIKYVPSFGNRGPVISDFVFDLYRMWFEDSSQKVNATVINATEGGARILNTKEQTLAELLTALPEKKRTPQAVLDSILSSKRPGTSDRLEKALTSAHEHVQLIQLKAEGTLEGTADSTTIDDLLDKEFLKIFNPFLRKTRTYLARYNSDNSSRNEMILKEIIEASKRLTPLLKQCLEDISAK